MTTEDRPMVQSTTSNVSAYLSEELRSMSSVMTDNDRSDPNLRPLHRLQRWCDTVLTNTPPGNDVLPLYLISRVLDDALDNLTGDFRYDEESYALRRTFFAELASLLGRLGAVDLSASDEWLPVITDVLERYLKVLAELNAYAIAHIPRAGDDL